MKQLESAGVGSLNLLTVSKLVKNFQWGPFEELIGSLSLKEAKAENLLASVMESSRSGSYLNML